MNSHYGQVDSAQMSASFDFEFMGTSLTAEYWVLDKDRTILFSSDAIELAKSITLSEMTADFKKIVEWERFDEEQVPEFLLEKR